MEAQLVASSSPTRSRVQVMLFSYAVRAVCIESSVMFVRGGVYRVVKEAMGGTLAKLSVSALLFDYVRTGRRKDSSPALGAGRGAARGSGGRP